MSEFGFQSFPEFSSVKKYTNPSDYDIYSDVMKSHQRSSIGNKTIEEYMQRDYDVPKSFDHFLYVSQLLQAEGISMGFSFSSESNSLSFSFLFKVTSKSFSNLFFKSSLNSWVVSTSIPTLIKKSLFNSGKIVSNTSFTLILNLTGLPFKSST